jgi:hypothetical protein
MLRPKKPTDEGLLAALCEASVLALLKSKQEVASVLVDILKLQLENPKEEQVSDLNNNELT